MIPGSEILTEANDAINGPRNTDYGHPADDFAKIAAMWSVILETPVTPVKVGMCMIALKIAREMNRHKTDNLIDIAGYAANVEMIHALEAEG